MENSYLKRNAILGFFFISILGTLSHFIYDWCQQNNIIGSLFAVNESTWEHLKIAIIPAIIWMVITLLTKEEKNNFFIANLLSFLTIMIVIVCGFYGYKALLQKDLLILDIILFYIAIGFGQYVSYKIMNLKKLPKTFDNISIILIILLFISFIVFTYFTPKNEIFKDPVNGGYGIESSK